MHKINILTLNRTIIAGENSILSDKLQEAGIPLNAYCSKKGVCGKCLIEIVKGHLPRLNEKEIDLIAEKGLSRQFRLACRYKVVDDMEINIPITSMIAETEILKTGVNLPVIIDPAVKKYHFHLFKPDIKIPYSFFEIIKKILENDDLTIELNLLKKLPEIIEKAGDIISAVLFNETEILDIEQGNTEEKSYGLAIDIGTSTVVTELINLNTGESIDMEYRTNSQIKFGADIISRISYACSKLENLRELQRTILNSINEMTDNLKQRNNLQEEHIYEAVIAGNTAMNHLFLGIQVNSLALAPFNAVFNELPELKAECIGLHINPRGNIYITPNIKSFVGGDISAGIIASDLLNRKGNFLFIDLGTNGEIVLKIGEEFIAASTAAGPAFEGINISNGMMAVPGAIFKAEYKDKLIPYTIKNEKPIGICGTGLVDLISIFLEKGEISDKGEINNSEKKIHITGNIWLIQKDVREVQLALSAVKAGIRLIMKNCNITFEQFDNVLIGGAFGNYLNIENAKRIGLLPPVPSEKIIFLGNSSLAGAKAILLSHELREKLKGLIPKIRHTSLGMEPEFQDYFIDALNFK